MSKSTKVILLSVIVLFIAGMALYPTIKKQFTKESVPKETAAPRGPAGGGRVGNPLNVNAKIIEPELLVDKILDRTAFLIPDEEVDLTFESAGKITEIYFREGTNVQKGQLLAKVNDKPLQAELQKLQAQIPLAEDRVFRQKALLEKDAVSKEAYEQVTTELEKLHADIDLVKARIAQTELRAPFDGIIGLRAVSEGAYVSPSTIIAHLTKITPLKIEFFINQKYVNLIRPGTNLTFNTVDNSNKYDASVYAVESRVDRNTHYLKVRAIYPNGDGKLKPGLGAEVEIKIQEIKDALVVPNEAVIAEMGRDIAFVYSGNKAKLVELKKGLRTESNVQIIEGLHFGDTLIISGIMQLRDGLPVSIDNIQ